MQEFVSRHIGPRANETALMLEKIGATSIDDLIYQTLPDGIRLEKALKLDEPMSEQEYLTHIKKLAAKNMIFKTYIGQGYYNTHTPSVILRNILENPSWYTSYTPYQAEISQGRLEALLNFQTVVIELTGMEIANASLLDEATAAAEAMLMLYGLRKREAVKVGANRFFVDKNVFPQTIDVLKTRAEVLGIEIVVGKYDEYEYSELIFGALVQYPASNGEVRNYAEFAAKLKENEISLVVAADILSLAILTPPGEWGAEVVVGNTQRFGVPMGFGGPHAAFFATKENYKRNMPGRIIGVSKDANGNQALRMALQTREQHIKREKATSNICTAQALLATMAGMYAVYHGAEGVKAIAKNIHKHTIQLSLNLKNMGFGIANNEFFDTLIVKLGEVSQKKLKKVALKHEVNFFYLPKNRVSISIDETTTESDIDLITSIFAKTIGGKTSINEKATKEYCFDAKLVRTSKFLQGDLFKRYHSETEMMRYIKRLERRDISLTQSMISLGSCTMKLNAATEMLPITWAEFTNIHPFVPVKQAKAYHHIIDELVKDLSEITGFDDVSLQPNSGAAGEYAGLLVINEYHKTNGQAHRNVALIPSSAHGTNPASAVMTGMKIIIVECDVAGNISVEDLRKKAIEHKDNLSAFMVTYPSTHGVFESAIIEMCKIIHENGGQVYMDGANMNAQVGLTNPARIGADVCHLNLHKTFAIPHGGGGPGVGPIAVAKHLAQFLPSHSVVKTGGKKGIKAVSAAPFGSANVLLITYGYIKMLGEKGLRNSTEYAILNANYMASSLKNYYDILYTGEVGRVAHEMILDCRKFKKEADISEADIAKRLMDYGFHAPTLSFPVHGTLMIEPTESESKQELDRFIDAMISIYNEIQDIKNQKADAKDNALKNAPHTAEVIAADEWTHAYSRKSAAFPLKWTADNKFWPSVGRIDDAYGDRNLTCSCAPIDSYRKSLYSND